jgi:TolB-like protein
MIQIAFLLTIGVFLLAPENDILAQEAKTPLRLAVIGFEKTGEAINPPDLDKIVNEWLTRFLVNTKAFEVVERQELEKVLQEQSLGQMGVLDPESAAQAGKILGVNILVTGTLMRFGDMLEVTTRLIDVTNGTITAVASVEVPEKDALRSQIKQLAEIIRRKLSDSSHLDEMKFYDLFDEEKFNSDRWIVEFDENVTDADQQQTTFSQQDGVLRLKGKYTGKAKDRFTWLAPNSDVKYRSLEAKVQVREVDGGASVCVGADWNDYESWAGLCMYAEKDYGDLYVALQDTGEQEATFEFDIKTGHWYTLRLEYTGEEFQYFWNDELVKQLSPATPLTYSDRLYFTVSFSLEEARSMWIEVDQILLR